jgi:hypothetical protein
LEEFRQVSCELSKRGVGRHGTGVWDSGYATNPTGPAQAQLLNRLVKAEMNSA